MTTDRFVLLALIVVNGEGDTSVTSLSRCVGKVGAGPLASQCKRMAREGLVETYRPAEGARLHVRITQKGRDVAAAPS